MADPLSIAASIAGLLTLTTKIAFESYSFISTVKDHPKELSHFTTEISLFKILFEQLVSHSNDAIQYQDRLVVFEQVFSAIVVDEFEKLLKEIEMSVKECQKIQGRRGDNFRKAVLWPFKARAVKEVLKKFADYRVHFNSALTVDLRLVSFQVTRTVTMRKTTDLIVIMV